MDAREKSYLMAVFLALTGGSCGGYALGSRDAGGQASRAYEAGRKAGFVQGQDFERIRPMRPRRRIWGGDGAAPQGSAER